MNIMSIQHPIFTIPETKAFQKLYTYKNCCVRKAIGEDEDERYVQ